jgi:hypothetical protein
MENYMVDPGLDVRIILKWKVNKYCVCVLDSSG